MTPLYVYALVDERLPRGVLGKGMARHPLRVVRAGGAFAVVERSFAGEATPAKLRAHDRVVKRVARHARAVLPMRFASTVATAVELERALATLPLSQAFDRVRDAVQFTLRVRGLGAPEAPRARRAGPGTRYLAKRFAEQTIAELAPVTTATRAWVRETRTERRPTEGVVYHLVAREHTRAWRAAYRKAVPDDVAVTMSGPWPPYAFAELT